MNETALELLEDALALPEEDRFELAEAIAASLQDSSRPPFDDSWVELVRKRSEELRNGNVKGVSWSEVKRTARELASG